MSCARHEAVPNRSTLLTPFSDYSGRCSNSKLENNNRTNDRHKNVEASLSITILPRSLLSRVSVSRSILNRASARRAESELNTAFYIRGQRSARSQSVSLNPGIPSLKDRRQDCDDFNTSSELVRATLEQRIEFRKLFAVDSLIFSRSFFALSETRTLRESKSSRKGLHGDPRRNTGASQTGTLCSCVFWNHGTLRLSSSEAPAH